MENHESAASPPPPEHTPPPRPNVPPLRRQTSRNSLPPAMVIADHPRNLPRTILVLPQLNELRLTHITVPRVMEAVHPNLHRAVSMQRIHLQRSGDQLPCHLSADVLFNGVQKRLLPHRQPRLVMIKLQVIGDERSQPLDIACVVSIEQL